ncbi:pilus assembly protein [Sinorhizobium meliloti]|nr:pilus assembly protein [Sinorhizobium meliloti]
MLANLELKFAKLQFSAKKRNRLYRKLNRFLNNGVPMTRALDILWSHASDDGRKPKESQAVIIDHWRRQVAEGRKLGQALKGWVPDSDRLVIEGGEAAGNLTVAIEKAMAINESAAKIKMTVIKGLTYPIMLVAAAIGLLVLIVRQVVPAFDAVLPKDQWEGLGAQMAFVANIIDNYLYLGLAALALLWTSIIWSMPRWTGGMRSKLDRFPPWSLYRLVLGSGFMLTVAGMIKAGIPLPTVLGMLGRDASPWYKQRLSLTLRWVNEGFNLGEALHKTGFDFPDRESVMDLRAYAGLNKFDEALEKLGTEWLEESVEKIEMQTAVLRNVGFAALGGTFMWIYGGIFSLQQQITAALQ